MAMHRAYFKTRFRVQRVRVQRAPERWPDPLVILSARATTGQLWATHGDDRRGLVPGGDFDNDSS